MPLTDLVRSFTVPTADDRPPTISRLGLSDVAVDKRYLIYERKKGANGKLAVEDSEDLQRILALPRRPRPSLDQQKQYAAAMTTWLRLDRKGEPCQCAALNPTAAARGITPCITELNPIQGWYLYEAGTYGGVLGFILVGGGKTGIDILIPMVLPDCRTYVLLLPPELVDQFNRDYRLWSQHFRTPNLAGGNGPFDPTRPTLRVLKYSELSRKNFATWLATMQPDAIGADEAQALKDVESVRGNRHVRFFEEYGDPNAARPFPIRAFYHSGSLTTRGLEDYSHLSALSLRDRSPVPLDPNRVTEWGLALNPAIGRAPAPMGALKYLCEPGERVREGFRRRLVETPGVVTTEDSDLDVALRVIKRNPGPVPKPIADALGFTREREMRPDGEWLNEKVEVLKVCRQLASGFYYRWKYPRGEPEALIEEWFKKRQAWFKEQRDKLAHRSDLLDSPELVEEAAKRSLGLLDTDGPKWNSRTYSAWVDIREKVVPEKDTVWIDDFLVKDSVAWLKEGPGIAFFWHSAFGEALAKATGLPCYWGKTGGVTNLHPTKEMLKARDGLRALGEWKENAASWLGVESGKRPIIVSLKAFHKGVNLQVFNRMLMCNSPSDNGIWEQAIGRAHRYGQQAKCVDVFVYRHTPEVAACLDDAKEYARYSHETIGKAEKLLDATFECF